MIDLNSLNGIRPGKHDGFDEIRREEADQGKDDQAIIHKQTTIHF